MHPRSRAKEFQSILKVVEKAGKKKTFWSDFIDANISEEHFFLPDPIRRDSDRI